MAMLVEEKITRVVLGGSLGRKFGRIWDLIVSSPAEALRMIAVNAPGFREELQRQVDSGMDYAVRVDYKNRTDKELLLPAGKTMLFMPLLEGAKNGGIFGIIAGVILIVIGVVLNAYTGVSGTPFIMAGAGMIAGGVIQMLSPMPKITDPGTDGGDAAKSYYFNGAASNETQGAPVPIIFGRMLVGSHPVSGSMEIQ